MRNLTWNFHDKSIEQVVLLKWEYQNVPKNEWKDMEMELTGNEFLRLQTSFREAREEMKMYDTTH